MLKQEDDDTLFKEIEALSNSEVHMAEDYMVVLEDDVDVVDRNSMELVDLKGWGQLLSQLKTNI